MRLVVGESEECQIQHQQIEMLTAWLKQQYKTHININHWESLFTESRLGFLMDSQSDPQTGLVNILKYKKIYSR